MDNSLGAAGSSPRNYVKFDIGLAGGMPHGRVSKSYT
jgi:hypothetical protein